LAVINEAALTAARADKQAVDMTDFEESIDRVVAGLERKSRVIGPKEKEIVAYHQAGHALIAELRPHADKVAKVSIIPRGVAALGHTRQLPTEDRYLLGRAELLGRIDVLLGGRTAEEIVFGDVSTGAQDDLQQATDLARHMIARFGMSEALGLAAFEQPRHPIFLDLSAGATREYSEETARIIDVEIRKLLDAAHDRVRATLSQRRAALNALAHLLVEKEAVDHEALARVLETQPPAPAA
jgi:cell division protease FtsH